MYCNSECHLSDRCSNHIKNNDSKNDESNVEDFSKTKLCRCETNYHDYKKVEEK